MKRQVARTETDGTWQTASRAVGVTTTPPTIALTFPGISRSRLVALVASCPKRPLSPIADVQIVGISRKRQPANGHKRSLVRVRLPYVAHEYETAAN